MCLYYVHRMYPKFKTLFYDYRRRRDLSGTSEYDENVTHEYNENESKGNINFISYIRF